MATHWIAVSNNISPVTVWQDHAQSDKFHLTAARCLRRFVKPSADMVPLAWLNAWIGQLHMAFES